MSEEEIKVEPAPEPEPPQEIGVAVTRNDEKHLVGLEWNGTLTTSEDGHTRFVMEAIVAAQLADLIGREAIRQIQLMQKEKSGGLIQLKPTIVRPGQPAQALLGPNGAVRLR